MTDPDRMRCVTCLFVLGVFLTLQPRTADAQREVVFQWLASNEATGFVVHLGQAAGSYQERLDLGDVIADPDGVHRMAVQLDDDSAYYAVMNAYNEFGESPPSNTILIPAPACDVAACDDGNSCTADDCTTDGCANRLLSDGTPCSTDGLCADGMCLEPECRAVQDCDDGDPCNGAESCDRAGVCLAGDAPDCGPPTQCAVPSCVPDRGCAMLPVPDGTSCDDGDRSTRRDRCVAGTCQGRSKSKTSRRSRRR